MCLHPPSAADVLRSIAHILARSADAAGWHQPAQLVRIDALPSGPADAVQFALHPLAPGVHPLAALDGFVADAADAGLGVVAEGEAYAVDGPGRARGPTKRVRVIELLLRDGTRVSALQPRGGALVVEGPPQTESVAGEITLALCRALGVPVVGGRLCRRASALRRSGET
jgi:hypothetical protein